MLCELQCCTTRFRIQFQENHNCVFHFAQFIRQYYHFNPLLVAGGTRCHKQPITLSIVIIYGSMYALCCVDGFRKRKCASQPQGHLHNFHVFRLLSAHSVESFENWTTITFLHHNVRQTEECWQESFLSLMVVVYFFFEERTRPNKTVRMLQTLNKD